MVKRVSLETPERKERATSARNKLQGVGLTLTYMSGYWASREPITALQVHEAVKAANPSFEMNKYPANTTRVFDLMSGPIRVSVIVDREEFILQQGLHKEVIKTVSYDTLKKAVKLISAAIEGAL